MKRAKAADPQHKLPIGPSQLLQIHANLQLDSIKDKQFWATITMCFFGLLRIGNATASHKTDWDQDKILKRSNITLTKKGYIVELTWTKTIQYKERKLQVAVPYLGEHPLCPTSALMSFWAQADHCKLPEHSPALGYLNFSGHMQVLTQADVRLRIATLMDLLGYVSNQYGTHSLRRGGATFLLLSGVPVEVIKSIGDWKSDCVLKYLTPDIQAKFDSWTKALSGFSFKKKVMSYHYLP